MHTNQYTFYWPGVLLPVYDLWLLTTPTSALMCCSVLQVLLLASTCHVLCCLLLYKALDLKNLMNQDPSIQTCCCGLARQTALCLFMLRMCCLHVFYYSFLSHLTNVIFFRKCDTNTKTVFRFAKQQKVLWSQISSYKYKFTYCLKKQCCNSVIYIWPFVFFSLCFCFFCTLHVTSY